MRGKGNNEFFLVIYDYCSYFFFRCYPSESIMQGLGDKLLLRTLAFCLGLKEAAVLRKRALQFGSRIANSKENAHDISPRL